MYRFLLILFIPLLSCIEEPSKIIDLRPPEDSMKREYVELGGIDTITDIYNLENAICRSIMPNSVVFIRIGINDDMLLDSNSKKDQILLPINYLDYDICQHKIMECFSLSRTLELQVGENDSIYHKLSNRTLTPELLTLYYSNPSKIRGVRLPFKSYPIGLALTNDNQLEIETIIRIFKKISFVYIQAKEEQGSIPPLYIHNIMPPLPPPPPPPLPDSL